MYIWATYAALKACRTVNWSGDSFSTSWLLGLFNPYPSSLGDQAWGQPPWAWLSNRGNLLHLQGCWSPGSLAATALTSPIPLHTSQWNWMHVGGGRQFSCCCCKVAQSWLSLQLPIGWRAPALDAILVSHSLTPQSWTRGVHWVGALLPWLETSQGSGRILASGEYHPC